MKLATDFFKAPSDSLFPRGLAVIIVLVLSAFTANAQTREGRWVLGIQGGVHTFYSDFDKHAYDVGGEVLLRYGLSEHFSLGLFTGYNDIRGETPYPLPHLNGLSLDMYTIPAVVVAWWHFTSMKYVSPYVYIGAGLVDMKKRDNFGNYPPDGRWHVYSVFPVGLGLEVPLSSAATLGFDVGMRYFGSDAVDLHEVSWRNDAYLTGRVGLNFYFGKGKEAEVEEAPPVITPAPAPVEKPAVPALPLPPELVTPANGATGVATNPTLIWNPSSGATSYRLQASTDPTFASTTVDHSGVTTTSDSLSGLATGTTYYWHVIAANSAGTSAYSTTWSFTTVSPPPPPVPVVPKEAPVVIEKGKAFILEGVNFEFNSARLTNEAVTILGKALTALQDHPDVKVRIVGHTDYIGSKKYNDLLSLRRANSVKSWLVSEGISATRITTAGVGFSEPIAPNDTPEGRAKNRRIEFHVEE